MGTNLAHMDGLSFFAFVHFLSDGIRTILVRRKRREIRQGGLLLPKERIDALAAKGITEGVADKQEVKLEIEEVPVEEDENEVEMGGV